MAVIPTYQNDIYVSYRHNDAILEWVTEFAEKLQQELDATLKGKLNIYYDKQGVGGELDKEEFEQKRIKNLKSLIFIPIISHTYCNTKKHNWEKEFLEFKQMAASDELGLNIDSENDTSICRILPIKIHEVEKKDIQLLERELGDNIRSVDFIYEGLEGVTRPLRSKDDEMAFSRSTLLYRNQINKTANIVSSLIKNIKAESTGNRKDETETTTSSVTSTEKREIKPTIYLSWTVSDCVAKRDELSLILQKAGMNVIPITDCPSEDNAFKSKVAKGLAQARCSIHLLGAQVGRKLESDGAISISMYQFNEAKKKIINGANLPDGETSPTPDLQKGVQGQAGFKQFIWQCPVNYSQGVEPEQQDFINAIRNNITSDMIFTNVTSPMQLVDDIRASLVVKEKPVLATIDTEVFFISNELDEEESREITDMLNDVVKIETLLISQEKDVDYAEMSVQQIKKSKLAAIYFREASDWALPFAQQIWKMIGGASSGTPLLLIGDDEIEANKYKLFNAPKVVSKIVAKDLIALEVKATYDKVIDGSI